VDRRLPIPLFKGDFVVYFPEFTTASSLHNIISYHVLRDTTINIAQTEERLVAVYMEQIGLVLL
jgi:hypothetical protein